MIKFIKYIIFLFITRQSLIAIEKNKYNPSLESALKLCEFFICKVEDLFQLEKTGEEQK
ncbi:helix-turn-helix domain-containing protein [Bacillus cereus]